MLSDKRRSTQQTEALPGEQSGQFHKSVVRIAVAEADERDSQSAAAPQRAQIRQEDIRHAPGIDRDSNDDQAVFPEYRRRGFGAALEKHMIAKTMKEGFIPFGQVEKDNRASLRLQEKLGMTVSRNLIVWMWRER